MTPRTEEATLYLCPQCDDPLFETGGSEGYISVYGLRERYQDTLTTGFERMMAAVRGDDEPSLIATLDGERVPVGTIYDLQAGDDGWICLFSYQDTPYCECGEHMMAVRYGCVQVEMLVTP